MPSDTKFFEETPRAVSSAYRGPHLVVTFHYHNEPDHEIVCHNEDELNRAQALADRLRVRL